MTKIRKVVHPQAWELRQARIDQAHITNQAIVEKPFWYENTENGQCYYDLLGCIGWPTEVSVQAAKAMPGYAAVVGVVKPKDEAKMIQDAPFQLLAEGESRDVPGLLKLILSLREEYGFGLHPGLLQGWWGDPDKFVTPLALLNERLISKSGENAAVLIIPPYDFYDPSAFENYCQSFHGAFAQNRFFWGHNKILRQHVRRFLRGNPAVMAIGGLVHTLLSHCTWAEPSRDAVFVIEEGF
ncbi:MAG: hypothetical protein GXY72_00225 [Deltaproteobacteria bacterium]|nr:hypothetical protein [Deltaproteobacteria bacterium]